MADWAEVQAILIRSYVVTGHAADDARAMIREMLWQAYEAGHVAGREVGRGLVWTGEVRAARQVNDPRPVCIACGKPWVPPEGFDATVGACPTCDPQSPEPGRWAPDRWVVIHDAGRGECGAILDRDGRCPACLIYPDRDRIDVVQRPIEVGSGG